MISFKPFNYTCMYVLQVMLIKILSIIPVDGLIQSNKWPIDRGEGRGCSDNIEGAGTSKGLATIRRIDALMAEIYNEHM